ncbi:transcription elongation factor [Deinococcus sp. SDU3-2]|uniref:Transcription elongation factor n=1 Tax=Deinococcus terrestris TaxID=2651870 RepID=A0A7X1TT71_9DEIO|nr:GreA/GreB family elongation factor [Deinococcus terrestris]MPY68214.1 transcription elongation factor [Deinococcus terrestris]
MPQPVPLTPEGLARLRRQLTQETERLEETRRVVREQMGANDQENQGLPEAQGRLLALQTRVDELEDLLARAVPIRPGGGPGDAIHLGSVVTLLDLGTNRRLTLQLVGPHEAAAVPGERPRVSSESPVGRALPGRRVGDTLTVDLGRRLVRYRVEEVRSCP